MTDIYDFLRLRLQPGEFLEVKNEISLLLAASYHNGYAEGYFNGNSEGYDDGLVKGNI
jgi:hypothetical protein